MQLQNIQITGGLTFIPEILTPAGDPYWANVSLLMNTTSTNNQNNNVFLDGSTNNFTVTRVGTPTQGSFTPFALAPNTSYNPSTNGGSGYFNGSTALDVPANVALQFVEGDFTMECWAYRTTTALQLVAAQDNGISNSQTFQWTISSSNNLQFTYFANSSRASAVTRTSSNTVSVNTWTHVAVSRSGSTLRLFINGVQGYSGTDSTMFQGTNITTLSGFTNGAYTSKFVGYISNFRILKGTALYTSAFTPPTTPLTAIANTSLLLNFTNGGIFDAATKNNLVTVADAKVSTAQSKFAPTSVVFDGTGDYLPVPTSPNFGMGTGDFTMEGWIYYTGSTPITSGVIVSTRLDANNGTNQNVLAIGYVTNKLVWSNGTTWNASTSNISANTWAYVAVSRSSGTVRVFINGQVEGTFTGQTGNYGSSRPCTIGAFDSTGTGGFTGYLQDIRVTKGIARYTDTFTPPTAPFPTN